MDTNEIGARLHYFSLLWSYWSDKCTNGEITENQMENRLDSYESKNTRQLKKIWNRIKREQNDRT